MTVHCLIREINLCQDLFFIISYDTTFLISPFLTSNINQRITSLRAVFFALIMQALAVSNVVHHLMLVENSLIYFSHYLFIVSQDAPGAGNNFSVLATASRFVIDVGRFGPNGSLLYATYFADDPVIAFRAQFLT